MMTGSSKSVPIHHSGSSFHGDSLLCSSPKACGLGSSPKTKLGQQGVMAMAYTTEGGGGASSVKDHYATLGVSPGASMHEIKKAYRRLALQHHPDVCDGDNCTLNFQQINTAYEVETHLNGQVTLVPLSSCCQKSPKFPLQLVEPLPLCIYMVTLIDGGRHLLHALIDDVLLHKLEENYPAAVVSYVLQSLLRKSTLQFGEFEDDLSDNLEGFMGVGDDSWQDWEEWMGWEGAGTRDYSTHINV